MESFFIEVAYKGERKRLTVKKKWTGRAIRDLLALEFGLDPKGGFRLLEPDNLTEVELHSLEEETQYRLTFSPPPPPTGAILQISFFLLFFSIEGLFVTEFV